MTYREKILSVLRDAYPAWVYGYDLEKVETKYGWIGTRGLRTCRDLAEKTPTHEPEIEKREDERGFVMYRALTPKRVVVYRDAETGKELARERQYA